MGDLIMRHSDKLAICVVCICLLFVGVSLVYAQSQEVMNATLGLRVDNLEKQFDKIMTYLIVAVVGLIGNLIAHIISIVGQRKQRSRY